MNPRSLLFLSFFLPFLSRAVPSVSCFESSDHSLIPTTYHACFQVIKFLIRHERIELPTLFSRKPNVGYHLPEQWRDGSCVIHLDMNDDATAEEEETATFKDIAGEAATIMLGCVVPRPHFGGTQFVGPKKVMNITIFGTNAAFRRPGLGDVRLG
ncbi:MAG: hypothetical protein L6R38_008699 [Xanthoria sp. 2 TBL-2021]|nr:MAG: hypothetical protein L6R38_008699 [Xanthoria sp. 2 TBL-2021]